MSVWNIIYRLFFDLQEAYKIIEDDGNNVDKDKWAANERQTGEHHLNFDLGETKYTSVYLVGSKYSPDPLVGRMVGKNLLPKLLCG